MYSDIDPIIKVFQGHAGKNLITVNYKIVLLKWKRRPTKPPFVKDAGFRLIQKNKKNCHSSDIQYSRKFYLIRCRNFVLNIACYVYI